MRDLSELDIQCLARLIDEHGTFYVRWPTPTSKTPLTRIVFTRESALEIKSILGLSKVYIWKQQGVPYRHLNRQQLESVLPRVMPHVNGKRTEAENMLELVTLAAREKPRVKEELDRMHELTEELRVRESRAGIVI